MTDKILTAIETAKRDFPHVDWDASLVRHNRVIQVAAFKDGEPIYVCSTNLEYAAKKDDMPDDITCVEPQSGPPDAFNIGGATRLEPGDLLQRHMSIRWSHR